MRDHSLSRPPPSQDLVCFPFIILSDALQIVNEDLIKESNSEKDQTYISYLNKCSLLNYLCNACLGNF